MRVSLTKSRASTRNGIVPDPAVKVTRVLLKGDPTIPFGAVYGFRTTVLEDVSAEIAYLASWSGSWSPGHFTESSGPN